MQSAEDENSQNDYETLYRVKESEVRKQIESELAQGKTIVIPGKEIYDLVQDSEYYSKKFNKEYLDKLKDYLMIDKFPNSTVPLLDNRFKADGYIWQPIVLIPHIEKSEDQPEKEEVNPEVDSLTADSFNANVIIDYVRNDPPIAALFTDPKKPFELVLPNNELLNESYRALTAALVEKYGSLSNASKAPFIEVSNLLDHLTGESTMIDLEHYHSYVAAQNYILDVLFGNEAVFTDYYKSIYNLKEMIETLIGKKRREIDHRRKTFGILDDELDDLRELENLIRTDIVLKLIYNTRSYA